jgi:hypothetical protein
METDFQDQLVILVCIVAAMISLFTFIAFAFVFPIPRIRHQILLGGLLLQSLAYSILHLLKWLLYRDREKNPWVHFTASLVSAWISSFEVFTHLELLHAFSPLLPFWTWQKIKIGSFVEVLAHFVLHYPVYAFPVLRYQTDQKSVGFYSTVPEVDLVATARKIATQSVIFSNVRYYTNAPTLSY